MNEIVPTCPDCAVAAKKSEAGMIISIPFWICPQCKEEISVNSQKASPSKTVTPSETVEKPEDPSENWGVFSIDWDPDYEMDIGYL